MKLSVENYVIRQKLGELEALNAIRAAGFSAVDFSFYWGGKDYPMYGDGYEAYARQVRAELDRIGLVCNQAHAPFDVEYGMEWNTDVPAYRMVVQAIHAAALLGAEQIVVHSIGLPEEKRKEEFDYNYRYYKSLEPYAEKYGVRIAVENLFFADRKRDRIGGRLNTPGELCAMVKALNSPCFTACVDLGHGSLTGLTPEAFVADMEPGLLTCLHVQDTDYQKDRHWLPFLGSFHWPAVMAALKSVGYDGDLTFEIFGYFRSVPADLLPEALTFARKVGEKLLRLAEEA